MLKFYNTINFRTQFNNTDWSSATITIRKGKY